MIHPKCPECGLEFPTHKMGCSKRYPTISNIPPASSSLADGVSVTVASITIAETNSTSFPSSH